MSRCKWAVVVPSNRTKQLAEFERAWGFDGIARLYVVRDEAPWHGIPEFIPRRTDMIRSWGFYQAWRDGCDYIVSLDDDVRPESSTDLLAEYEAGFETPQPCSPYLSVGALTDTGHQMRGFPYKGQLSRVAVQYGGWNGVADFDAITQLAQPEPMPRCQFKPVVMPVPRGVPTTCCAMNFAFRAEYAPIMWQLPLYKGKYNRMGDIWSGLLSKKVLDASGAVAVVNGLATVYHQRASDPFTNLEREAPGMRLNERLWAALDQPDPSATLIQQYRQVTDSAYHFFDAFDPEYAEHFGFCQESWLELFE